MRRRHAVQFRAARRARGEDAAAVGRRDRRSGTIANEDTGKGASCLAEQRTVETLRDGKPSTPFLKFGDTVRIEITDAGGASVFGAIEQVVSRG
jgi:hypothetical protein